VRLVAAMTEQNLCPHCGQPMPTSRAEAIEARVATWRAWCGQNGRWVSPDDRVNEATAAELIGRTSFTLRNWRSAGQPLPFVRVRGRISYRLRDLALMLEESE
jgi:hypothetical protein